MDIHSREKQKVSTDMQIFAKAIYVVFAQQIYMIEPFC